MNSTINTKTRSRRGRPVAQGPQRHRELLDAVARQINRDGAGSVSLSDLCGKLSLSRSALYFYCSDSDDLIHQAYQRSCSLLSRDLEHASALSAAPDRQVVALIRRVLDEGHAPMAVLNDLDYLPARLQADIQAAHSVHVQQLRELLQRGQVSGHFRDFDPGLASQLILNLLSWAIISIPWLQKRADSRIHAAYTETLCDLLMHGVAEPGMTPNNCEIDYDQLVARPINVFDKSQAADMKSDQILAMASRLFNLRGLDGVRLEAIGDAIGVTKGAVYHHFQGKADLIGRCYERAFDIYDLLMETGIAQGANALDFAQLVIHLNTQAQLSVNAPLALQPGLGKLKGAQKTRFRNRARRLSVLAVSKLSDDRTKERKCRPLAYENVPGIQAGYFTGLSRWAPSQLSPHRVADFVSDIAVFGLANRK